MHEVETLLLEAREQRRPLGHVDRVPAHVREHVRLDPVDRAGPLPQAGHVDVALDAAVEHDLHADADAQHRAAARQTTVDDAVAAGRTQRGHHGGERPDPGDEEAVGLVRPLRVARQLDIGAGQLERLDGGVDVAAPVVEDDDGGPRHSAPFVDGMPDTRGSSSFA